MDVPMTTELLVEMVVVGESANVPAWVPVKEMVWLTAQFLVVPASAPG